MTIDITDENFDSLTLNSSKPIVLDFWAPKCGPCKTLSPYIDDLGVKYNGRVLVGKVNVDSNIKLALKFGVRSIPTILYLRNGEIIDKHIGSTSMKVLEEKLVHNFLEV